MNFVYVMISDSCEWEDIVIYLTEEDAIKSSKMYPNTRIEIFINNFDFNGFTPTYRYYKDGKYYEVH
jgi:hypothetical protein